MSNKAIIFDLDGTLVDSVPLILKCYSEGLSKHGITPVKEKILALMGLPTLNVVLELVGGNINVRIEEVIKDIFDCFSRTWMNELRLYPGIEEVLNKLREKGYKLGIVTSSEQEHAEIMLDFFKLKKYFDIVQGRVDHLKPKPYPDMILYVLNQLKVESENALYVGDTFHDCVASAKANVKFILVERGWGGKFLRGCLPWKILNDLKELLVLT
ncbi:MAG: HAD family hydrolase [Thermosphaera sp.]